MVEIPSNEGTSAVTRTITITDMGYSFEVEFEQSGENNTSATLPETPIFWLDAINNTGKGSSMWYDSINNMPMTLYNTTVVDGESVTFGSKPSYITTGSTNWHGLTGSTDFTMVWAGNLTQFHTLSGYDDLSPFFAQQRNRGSNTGRWAFGLERGSNTIRLWGNDGTSRGFNSTKVPSFGNHIFIATRKDNVVTTYVDGEQYSTASWVINMDNSGNGGMPLNICCYNYSDGTSTSTGWKFYSGVIYNRAFSSDEINQVNEFMNNRYNMGLTLQ